jgi:histidine ammonia-lyase
MAQLRAVVPALGEDRYMATEIEAASDLIASGGVAHGTGVAMPELGA